MLSTSLGLLYVGSLNSAFGEIKVTKALKGLDKKIIECSWDYNKNQWKFMRERTDKSFPNAYATAEGKKRGMILTCTCNFRQPSLLIVKAFWWFSSVPDNDTFRHLLHPCDWEVKTNIYFVSTFLVLLNIKLAIIRLKLSVVCYFVIMSIDHIRIVSFLGLISIRRGFCSSFIVPFRIIVVVQKVAFFKKKLITLFFSFFWWKQLCWSLSIKNKNLCRIAYFWEKYVFLKK